jgi:hypothetical protein
MNWRKDAYSEVFKSRLNPDHVPRYRIPARKWWQFWKPKWEQVEGVSYNQIQRGHGLPPSAEMPAMRTLGDDIFDLFGIR